MSRIHEIREVLYKNVYDSLDFRDSLVSHRLFGNQNVGMLNRSNLQVAGQVVFDGTFNIFNVYVRSNVCQSPMSDDAREVVRDAFLEGRDEIAIDIMLKECRFERTPLTRAFDEWAHSCVLEVVVGNKTMFTMNVHDLLGGPAFGSTDPEQPTWRRQLGIPISIPERQNFSVRLDSFGGTLDRLRDLLPADILPAPLLWVHIEGQATRDVV